MEYKFTKLDKPTDQVIQEMATLSPLKRIAATIDGEKHILFCTADKARAFAMAESSGVGRYVALGIEYKMEAL